jgi:SAM-dependent methyltransferase
MVTRSTSEWYLDLEAPVRIASSFPIIRDRHLASGSVLDVGCGTGSHLAQFPIGSLGLDLSSPNVEACRARGLTAVFADLNRSLPLRDRSFETVFISHVLEHVESPTGLLRESARIARSRVVLALPIEGSLARFVLRDPYFAGHPTHLYGFSVESLDRLFDTVGLRVVDRVFDFPGVRRIGAVRATLLLNRLPVFLLRRLAANVWYVGTPLRDPART